MQVANKIKRLFGNLLRRRQLEDTLDAELRAYVEELTDRNIARGMPRDLARREALLETAGIEQLKEEVRAAWLGHGLETTFQDIRYACRSLLRSPGFAVVVVATLAAGIGASVAMFALMRAVLWRPMPYPEPDRVVIIQVEARNIGNAGATMGEVRGLTERSHTLQQVSIINPVAANLEYASEMEHVSAASVSDNFLPQLGAPFALGRTLDSNADEGKQQVLAIVISNELWRRRFSADLGIIGKAVRVNNLDVRIKGVLASGFRLYLPPAVTALEQIDVWFPTGINATTPYRGNPIAARLRVGVTLDQANAEMQTWSRNSRANSPRPTPVERCVSRLGGCVTI